jgi:phosphatidylglycerol:prolipoprotein diacylglycerol transferase
MHPIICQIGPITLYSYGLALVVAFVAGSTLAGIQAKKQNMDSQVVLNMAFLVFISGIIGARIFYVIENASYYIKNPQEIIMLQRGGLSWFGGLISGILSGIAYLKKKKLPVYKTLDLIVPFLALAQAIGRIGCLLNGCCFGRTLIPIQIYSSLALIFIFMFLRFLQDRPHRGGTIFFAYLLLYSVKRFFLEFWRADNEVIFLGLTLFQIIGIAIFFLALSNLALILKPKR